MCLPDAAKGSNEHFLCSARVPRPLYTKPCESTNHIRLLACPADNPCKVKKLVSCIATPTPAEPAPKNRIRWSFRSLPDAAEASLAAFMKPLRTTAPVPWMSSLKTGYLLRYLSRYLKAFSDAKSYTYVKGFIRDIRFLQGDFDANWRTSN
jgi:hypothetical protein